MATLKKAVELSPRDEHYQFNLASVYLTNRKVDDAIAILKSLAGSSNPEVAMRANQMLP
jgi:predicted Zn-dependent protease